MMPLTSTETDLKRDEGPGDSGLYVAVGCALHAVAMRADECHRE